MDIIEQRVLRGANLHSAHPCLMTVLDLGELGAVQSTDIAGFNDRVLELLPSLYDHRCTAGKYAGFVQSLKAGTNLAHLVEHLTIALQCLAGTPVNTGRTIAVSDTPGRYRVVCAYELEAVVIDAFDLAVQLTTSLANGDTNIDQQLVTGLASLRELAERQAIGTSSGAIVKAARKRGIPVTASDGRRQPVPAGLGRAAKAAAGHHHRLTPGTSPSASPATSN
jgi:cyanophycin synthetase